MDRIWQWAWERYATRYSWAIYAVTCCIVLAVLLVSAFVIIAFEESGNYVEAALVVVAAMPVVAFVNVLPGVGGTRHFERWAAGYEIAPARALEATYSWARTTVIRAVVGTGVLVAATGVGVGAIAGASAPRLVQYAILGAAVGTGVQLVGVRSFLEGAMRPVRTAIAGDTGIGDSLPRGRPTFASWSNVAMLAAVFGNAVSGAMLGMVFLRVSGEPVVAVIVGAAMTVGFAVPLNVGAAFSQSFLPIRDLARGTERVAAGDYSQRLPIASATSCASVSGSTPVW